MEFLLENSSISILSTVTHNEDDLTLLRCDQLLGGSNYCLQNMAVAGLVSANLVHPHIDDQHIGDRQAEEGHFLLKHLILRFPLCRIKALRIDHIKIIDVMNPDSLGTPLARECCIQHRKAGVKYMVEKSAFPRALCTEHCDV